MRTGFEPYRSRQHWNFWSTEFQGTGEPRYVSLSDTPGGSYANQARPSSNGKEDYEGGASRNQALWNGEASFQLSSILFIFSSLFFSISLYYASRGYETGDNLFFFSGVGGIRGRRHLGKTIGMG